MNIIANVRDMTRLREADDLKNTFISVISHELKTPVALIKGYAGTLRREDARWDAATVRDSAAVIEEEADHLTRTHRQFARRVALAGRRLEVESQRCGARSTGAAYGGEVQRGSRRTIRLR